MAILSAALAFAITMLILSMVTSVFVETIHRFIGLREKGLRIMLGHVYDRIVAPYVDKQGVSSGELKETFVDLMSVNRAPAGEANSKPGGGTFNFSQDGAAGEGGLLSWLWSGRRLARLNAEQFMSRLGGSDFGDHVSEAIRSAGIENPEAALKDIAARFEQFGREASVFFERRARLLSVIAAMVVAWLMYVQPYELFRTFMDKPEVTGAVIAMQADVMNKYEAQVSKAAEDAAKAADADAAAEASGDAAAAENTQKTLDEANAKRDEAIAAMKAATGTLTAAGVPIGWTKQRLDAAGFKADNAFGLPIPNDSRSMKTILWLIVGGLLVGLGGPFWYDMVKSLSSIRTLATGAKSLANTGEASKDSGAAGGDALQPQTPVDHYTAARSGREAEVAVVAEEDDAVG